jgi:GAF domain-containing protein
MPSRKENGNSALKTQLQGLILALEGAGRASLPLSDNALLHSIVEAAARIFQAAAASILLVNEAEGVLEFKVSTDKDNQKLIGTNFPLDQGIAGYVVMTGQPLAISNVEQDARFNRDFAQSTGYVPHSILAMPLVSGERILGVMEVLDKIDAPSFGMQDMELLGLFARQAALAIELSQQMERLSDALVLGLKRLAQTPGESGSGELMAAFDLPPDPSQRGDLMQLAAQLNEFTQLGEEERKTALKILAAFGEYAQVRRRSSRGAARR